MRRVLKLVDEQVLNAAIEREQELRRRIDLAERTLCRERELDEIDGPLLSERDLELCREPHEDDLQRGQALPLPIGVARVR